MASDTPAIEHAASKSRENQLRFVITVAMRHWRMILGFALAGMVGYGLMGMWRFPRDVAYEARTDLIVRQSPWDKEILHGVGGAPLVQSTPKALIERVTKRAVAEDVVRSLVQEGISEGLAWGKLASEPEYAAKTAEIVGDIEISPVPESETIQIKAKAGAPDDAKQIAEFASRAFIDRHRRLLLEEEEDTHEFVETQLDELRRRLDQAETSEWRYREKMGFRTHDQVMVDMETMNRELTTSDARREEILGKMTEIEGKLDDTNAKLPTSLGQISDNVVSKLFDGLAELLTKELYLRVEFQPDVLKGDPQNLPPEAQELQALRDEIAAKEAAILEALGSLDGGIQSGAAMWQGRQELVLVYRNLQLELMELEIGVATRKRMLGQMVEELPALAAQSFEYKQLTREVEQLRKQFDALFDKEFEVRTAIRRGAGQIERNSAVLASAVEGARSRIQRWVNFVVGGLVGLLFGFGLAIMMEMLDTSIRSIEDVAEYLGIEVIGAIPLMRFGKTRGSRRRADYIAVTDEEHIDACIVTHYDPKSPISEAYRTLRTNFQFATITRKPRTIMVTSAVPGEGKTTTAVNMAVTFADSGMRVLMIDTDLRRPHVHHVLKMDRGLGLADVLREGLDHSSVIRPTRVQNLWIVSSGRVPPNPSELIASSRMDRLMKQLGAEFDVVICDAPSMLVVTDPVLLATHVETVVLVVAVNNARRETILRAKKLLETAHAQVAGVVLNGLEATRRHYYYYYYYYEGTKGHRRRRWYHF